MDIERPEYFPLIGYHICFSLKKAGGGGVGGDQNSFSSWKYYTSLFSFTNILQVSGFE